MKTFFILFAFFSVSNSFAQLEKNTWLVGGNGRFQSYKYSARPIYNYNDGKYKELNLNSFIGYFPIDKLAIGVKPSLELSKSVLSFGNGSGRTNNKIFYFGPFVRYYLLAKEKQINFLTDFSYQIGKRNDLGENYDSNSSSYSLMVGTEIFFNTTSGIELLVGYSSKKERFNDGNEIKKGLQINIGFQIHLIK
jgi:hypothetical protein